MKKSTLSRQVMLSISAVTLSALAVMFFGSIFYYYNYEWLVPAAIQAEEAEWVLSDFVALAIFVAISLVAAGIVGWRLARRILRPLEAVAKALRSITTGDFSARAEMVPNGFGEAETLISDFNTMAGRLEPPNPNCVSRTPPSRMNCARRSRSSGDACRGWPMVSFHRLGNSMAISSRMSTA